MHHDGPMMFFWSYKTIHLASCHDHQYNRAEAPGYTVLLQYCACEKLTRTNSSTLRSCDLHGAARFAILAPPAVILSRITPPCTLVRCVRCNCAHSATSHG